MDYRTIQQLLFPTTASDQMIKVSERALCDQRITLCKVEDPLAMVKQIFGGTPKTRRLK
jgi:hypothetical protein